MAKKKPMTRAEFARRWDSGDDGGGITGDDVAECAKAWGLCAYPRTTPFDRVLRMVVLASGATTGIPPKTTRTGEAVHELTGEQLAHQVRQSAETGQAWLLYDEDGQTQIELDAVLHVYDLDGDEVVLMRTGAGPIALLAQAEYQAVRRD